MRDEDQVPRKVLTTKLISWNILKLCFYTAHFVIITSNTHAINYLYAGQNKSNGSKIKFYLLLNLYAFLDSHYQKDVLQFFKNC